MHALVASLVASVCVGHGNLVLIWHKLLSTITLALVCILDNKRPQHLASHYKMQNQLCFVVCVCVECSYTTTELPEDVLGAGKGLIQSKLYKTPSCQKWHHLDFVESVP